MALAIFSAVSATASASDTEHALQAILDATTQRHPQFGILASASAPEIGLEWSGASGPRARGEAPRLAPNDPFRIASVTKVFVAAATFRLIEDGAIGLYDPIDRYISPGSASTLRSGGYDPHAIVVQQLLAHTSGLYDYAMDASYGEALRANPSKRWTRAEQITWAMQHGKPLGAPGRQYAYADTGYVLLGEIIERVSGKSLPVYVREALSLDALGLDATYFESLEAIPTGARPRVHQYWLDTDVTDFDPSVDLYGGGGLVSSTGNLTTFMRAVLTGKLFHRPNTLAASLVPSNAAKTEGHARGNLLYTVAVGERTCWGHGGFLGTLAVYCPDVDLAVAINVDVSIDDKRFGGEEPETRLAGAIAAAVIPQIEKARNRAWHH